MSLERVCASTLSPDAAGEVMLSAGLFVPALDGKKSVIDFMGRSLRDLLRVSEFVARMLNLVLTSMDLLFIYVHEMSASCLLCSMTDIADIDRLLERCGLLCPALKNHIFRAFTKLSSSSSSPDLITFVSHASHVITCRK